MSGLSSESFKNASLLAKKKFLLHRMVVDVKPKAITLLFSRGELMDAVRFVVAGRYENFSNKQLVEIFIGNVITIDADTFEIILCTRNAACQVLDALLGKYGGLECAIAAMRRSALVL